MNAAMLSVLTSQLPAQCHCSHRYPCDAADAPPLLAAVTMATAGVVIFLLFLGVSAPIAAVAAAVVDEKGQNDEEGQDESDGREAGQNQQGLEESEGRERMS